MDVHTLPTHVSRSCSVHRHTGCPQIGCECSCHLSCAKCGREDANYNASQIIGFTHLVCATCFVALLHEQTHHVCVECGDFDAYQELVVSHQYRCVACHQKHERIHLTRWAC